MIEFFKKMPTHIKLSLIWVLLGVGFVSILFPRVIVFLFLVMIIMSFIFAGVSLMMWIADYRTTKKYDRKK